MVTLKYNWRKFSSEKSGELFSRRQIIFSDEVFPNKVQFFSHKNVSNNLLEIFNYLLKSIKYNLIHSS